MIIQQRVADGSEEASARGAQRLRLTKQSVEDLRPADDRFVVWDVDIKGFHVEVLPSGKRSFRLTYRPPGSRRVRKMTLGVFGAITVDEARKLAKRNLGAVANGADPAKDRAAARQAATVGTAIEHWLTEHVEPRRKARTAATYKALWTGKAARALGSIPLAEVSRADIAALHRKYRATPYQANRLAAMLRAFFNWAERQELRPANSNPVRLIELYREEKRDRLLTSDGRLGEALRKEEAEAEASHDLARHWALAAIALILFTGARRGEILGLRWDEIDLDAGVARLPDSKTGKKTLHLGTPARAVLARVKRLPDNPYVICGRLRGAPLVGLPKIWERVRQRAGLPGLRLHDLRHAFASTAAMNGMSLPTIGRLLGHSQPAVTDRYAHFASSPLVDAADRVAEMIAKQLAGNGGLPDEE